MKHCKMKIALKNAILTLFVSVTAAICCVFGLMSFDGQQAQAEVTGTEINLDAGNGKISGDGLKQLYGAIYSGATTYSEMSAGLGTGVKKASEVNATVTLGGYKWIVAYVSKAEYSSTETDHVQNATFGGGSNAVGSSGDVIATLWLADVTVETAGIDMVTGWRFSDGGYSKYTESVKTPDGISYPTNMYSSSYIRSLLNNTNYAYYGVSGSNTNIGQSNSVTINTTGVQKTEWADFLSTYGSFISTPAQMDWQYTTTRTTNYPNEGLAETSGSWSNTSSTTGYETMNYTSFGSIEDNTAYASWGNDKLWLPSLFETGSIGETSLWGCNISMKSYSDGNGVRLRSGNFNSGDSNSYLMAGTYGGSAAVYLGISARPAFHLNLNAVDMESTKTETDVTLEYSAVKLGETVNPALTVKDGTTVLTFAQYGTPTYSITSGSQYATIDPVTGALTGKALGTVTVEVSIAETDKYFAETATYTVTIQKATLTDTTTGYNGAYDGAAHGITVSATGFIGSDTFADTATVKYGTEEGEYELDTCPTQTNAGTLTVYYEVTFDNYETITGSVTVTVTQRDISNVTVTVTGEYEENGTEIVPTFTVTDGDIAITEADYIVAYSDNVNAGTATITLTGAGNYTGTKTQTFEITSAPEPEEPDEPDVPVDPVEPVDPVDPVKPEEPTPETPDKTGDKEPSKGLSTTSIVVIVVVGVVVAGAIAASLAVLFKKRKV